MFLAALGLLWIGRVLLTPGPDSAFALATYTAELSGQVRDLRSQDAPDDLPVFALGSRFRLVLEPDRAVTASPQIELLLADEAGRLRPWDVGYSRNASGAIKIEGVLGEDLPIAPGAHTLVLLYGRPGALPAPSGLAELRDRGTDWRAVRVGFTVMADDRANRGPPLAVRYAGCYAGTPGPVCVPHDELTLWLRTSPQATVAIRVGDRDLLADEGLGSVAVDGGRRYTVPVASADGTVEVTATAGGETSRFRLALAANDEPKWFRDVRRLAYEGEVAEARTRLEAGFDDAPAELRGSISSLLARLHDAPAEHVRLLEEAVELHRDSGRLLELADDLGMLRAFDVERRPVQGIERQSGALVRLLETLRFSSASAKNIRAAKGWSMKVMRIGFTVAAVVFGVGSPAQAQLCSPASGRPETVDFVPGSAAHPRPANCLNLFRLLSGRARVADVRNRGQL